MTLQPEQRSETGLAVWHCGYCRNDFDGPAEMIEGNMDPAAAGDSDRCPVCCKESDECVSWQPDTARGMRMWLEAGEERSS